jgi:hypothetical protein
MNRLALETYLSSLVHILLFYLLLFLVRFTPYFSTDSVRMKNFTAEGQSFVSINDAPAVRQ